MKKGGQVFQPIDPLGQGKKITLEIRKCYELNGNKNSTYQNVCNTKVMKSVEENIHKCTQQKNEAENTQLSIHLKEGKKSMNPNESTRIKTNTRAKINDIENKYILTNIKKVKIF